MSDIESLNQALEVLKRHGHTVTVNPGACVIDGVIHVPIDGRLRSASAIYQMVAPPDTDVYGFEARGHKYEVHIHFLYGGMAYEMYQDGETLGDSQRLDEAPLDFVQRTAENMGGASSLRRL
jgi:hypothetical protein